MKIISILVPKNAILGSLEGTRLLLTQVNSFMKMKGAEPLFKLRLIGLSPETRLSGGLFTANADILVDEAEDKSDLVIIPAIEGDLVQGIEDNRAFLPWIMKQRQMGAEVASLCVGAFLLASTGLLKNRKCATHWLFADQFRTMFPEVDLQTEKIITEEDGIYSSGGAFSYYNLILYIIEKYAGRDIAILCAKVFAIEIERESQSPFIIFNGQKEHGDEPVKNAQNFIESNFREKITVYQLASMFALGRRNLERRFKKATSNTVNEYIQRVKIEAAKKSFETSNKNVNEIMYDVGYSDVKAFRTIFRKITGLSPLEYRNKYRSLSVA